VYWALSRDPERWPETAQRDVRAILTRPAGGIPPLIIYFSFTDQQVELHSIQTTNPDGADDTPGGLLLID